MTTAVISDLHLGAVSDADVARRPEVVERLAAALSRADRLVVLGDLLELRERRADEVLELAAPVLAAHRRGRGGTARSCWCPATTTTSWSRPRSRGRAWTAGSCEREGTYAADTGPLSRRVAGDAGPRARQPGLSRACGCATTSGPRTATTPTCT